VISSFSVINNTNLSMSTHTHTHTFNALNKCAIQCRKRLKMFRKSINYIQNNSHVSRCTPTIYWVTRFAKRYLANYQVDQTSFVSGKQPRLQDGLAVLHFNILIFRDNIIHTARRVYYYVYLIRHQNIIIIFTLDVRISLLIKCQSVNNFGTYFYVRLNRF